MGAAIDSANLTALGFRVDVVWVSRVLKHPKSIAIEHIFPTMIGDATWVLRITYPRAVVLQSAIHLIGILLVQAYMIELRHRQVFAFPPFAAAVVRVPHPAIVSREHDLRVGRIDPDVVRVAVRALETAYYGKALSAALAPNPDTV